MIIRNIVLAAALLVSFTAIAEADEVIVGLNPTNVQQNVKNIKEPMPQENESELYGVLIENQSFLTDLSEYEGEVFFASYSPLENENDARFQIEVDGSIAELLEGYVPEQAKDMHFVSVDAISFVDYDNTGNTDIFIIKSWENYTAALVYDGSQGNESGERFALNKELSDLMTESLQEFSIAAMLDYFIGEESYSSISAMPTGTAGDYIFASGVGAWEYELHVDLSGYFTGFFSDTNMGESGDGYLAANHYSSFYGNIGNIQNLGNGIYSLDIISIGYEDEPGTSWIDDNLMLHSCETVDRVIEGDYLLLFANGAYVAELPYPEVVGWIGVSTTDTENQQLMCNVIYNPTTGACFVG